MSIKFNRSQTFATNGTVTASGLHNLVDGLDIYQALITDQTSLSAVAPEDSILIADASLAAGDAPRQTTVSNLFDDALTGGTYTNINLTGNLTYGTATGNKTVSTSATITTGTINNATLGTTTGTAATFPTLTAGTTTSTAANVTMGTIGNLTTTLAGDFTISSGTGTLGTTGVTAGTYGTSTIIPQIAVDAKGRVTSMGTSEVSAGKVLQVQRTVVSTVVAVNAAFPVDNTIPQNTEGVEVLVTASFSPVSASSTLYFKFSCSGRPSLDSANISTALFQDSITNALFAASGNTGAYAGYPVSAGFQFAASSSSTTARVYKIRGSCEAGTFYINGNGSGNRLYGGVQEMSLEIWEVA